MEHRAEIVYLIPATSSCISEIPNRNSLVKIMNSEYGHGTYKIAELSFFLLHKISDNFAGNPVKKLLS